MLLKRSVRPQVTALKHLYLVEAKVHCNVSTCCSHVVTIAATTAPTAATTANTTTATLY